MPHDTTSASLLDRLRLVLKMATGLAVLGAFAAVLAAATATLGIIGLWLPRLPAGGGGLGLLFAACGSWLMARGLAQQPTLSPRLAICLRLERAFPKIGERLSRAIGLVRPDASGGHMAAETLALQKGLRQAAREDARRVLEMLPLRNWVYAQPEVRAAVAALTLAILCWAGIAWSLVSGSRGWQDALVKQFRESPVSVATEQLGADEAAESQSIPEATLLVFRRTAKLRDHWQRLTTSQPEDTSRLAHEAAFANSLATSLSSERDAVILQRLAAGLRQAAGMAVSREKETPSAISDSDIADQLGRLVAIGEAAGGLAQAGDAVAAGSRMLFHAAADSAGLTFQELGQTDHAWRDDLSGHLSAVIAGIAADRSLLVKESLLPVNDLPAIDTSGLAMNVRQNRLFLVSRQLAEVADSLATVSSMLGMPPVVGSAADSLAAIGRRQVIRMAKPETAPQMQPSEGERPVAGDTPNVGIDGEETSVVVADVPRQGRGDSVADSNNAAGSDGQPTSGVASDTLAAPASSAENAPASLSGNVWIPEPSVPQKPAQPGPPAGRVPRATPGYFRRILEGAGQTGMLKTSAQIAINAASFVWLAGVTEAVEEAPETHADPPDAAAASAAVERGIAWLVAAQRPDGSFGSARFGGSVAVTAHGLLALASTGSTGVAGPHAEACERAIDFLIDRAANDGLIAGNEDAAHGPMYGHAFAVQALAEISGETSRPEITAILRRGCRLIEQTQNDAGGWRYQPRRADADVSVTAAMVVALEAAAAAGIAVSDETVQQGVAYLLRLQNEDGGFRYQSAAGPSGPARTAAAIVALRLASPDSVEPVSAGRRWLGEHSISSDPADGYAAYGILASSIAAWQAGEAAWAEWYTGTAAELLAAQAADGSWPDASCPEYGTAAAVLSLTTANGLLPGWKRGRP